MLISRDSTSQVIIDFGTCDSILEILSLLLLTRLDLIIFIIVSIMFNRSEQFLNISQAY